MTLGPGVPALFCHPDGRGPAPLVLWLHGRTSRKEVDSGRYLRLVRAGVAVLAIDLPGHGDRAEPARQGPGATLGVIGQALGEVGAVLEDLRGGELGGLVDADRLGVGGMSAGGMIALRLLCEDHPFRCASVEATTGALERLYFPDPPRPAPWAHAHDRARVRELDALAHLDRWRPIALLALHSRADAIIPFETQERFLEALRERYRRAGADAGAVELLAFDTTGAPQEHMGFGRRSHEAKSAQTSFFARHLAGGGG